MLCWKFIFSNLINIKAAEHRDEIMSKRVVH